MMSDIGRRTLLRGNALLVMILMALILSGCTGDMVTGRVEDSVRDRLPDLIGPAKSYEVQVSGSSWRMMKGKIAEVRIHGKEVWIMPDLCVDDLNVCMKDVVADRKDSTVKSVGKIEFTAATSETALNKYLDKRAEEQSVRLLSGKALVTARPKVLGITTKVAFTGYLKANGRELNLVVTDLDVAGVGTPRLAAKCLEDYINPVLTLKADWIVPKIGTVKIEPGQLVISGTAELPPSTATQPEK